MKPTPTSASSDAPSWVRSAEEPFRVVRKRNRLPVSCYPCRTRKKCDRNHPCSHCVRREGPETTSCLYATPSTQKNKQNQGTPSPGEMQNRIDRLEDLVLVLMRENGNNNVSTTEVAATAAAAATSDSNLQLRNVDREDGATMGVDYEDDDDADGLASSLGVLNIDSDKGKSVYIGQEHWHTILSEISEVKAYCTNRKRELENGSERVKMSKPASARGGFTLLNGAVPPATYVELQAELPPRSTILALCARYFDSMDNPITILHSTTFHQQLRAHWQDPSKTPVMWLGLLYSVLCLAMLSYHRVGDEPLQWKGRTLEMAGEFQLRTVQCLIRADYTKPVEYTVETMLLYVFGEYNSRWDADLGLWLVISLVIKIAIQMGYHRDAKWFPSLTPFQAEMRRRTWALLRIADVMFSHQVSLPNMICSRDCDTQVPTNLFDEEFGPDTKVLPPSHPNTELTPTGYTIAKVKLCREMSDILQATNRVEGDIPYDDILRFDTRLRKIYQELPPYLQAAPQEDSQDSAMVIMSRFSINSLYLKIVCLLHKKYVPRARKNPRYAYSRQSAIEAASKTLRHLVNLDRESRPGERLQSLRWFLNSMATKEFLVCAMLVTLDLYYDRMAETTGAALFWTPGQRKEMTSNLEMTKDFWEGLADSSAEALQASRVLEIMLGKIKSPSAMPADGTGSASADCFSSFESVPNMQLGQMANMTLGMFPEGATPNTATAIQGMQASSTFGSADFSAMSSGWGITPNIGGEDFSYNSAGPPFSIFPNFEAGPGFPANFDWWTDQPR